MSEESEEVKPESEHINLEVMGQKKNPIQHADDGLPTCTQSCVGISPNSRYHADGGQHQEHEFRDRNYHVVVFGELNLYGVLDGYVGTGAAKVTAKKLEKLLCGQHEDGMTDEDVTTALKQASLEAKKEFLEKNSSSPPEIADLDWYEDDEISCVTIATAAIYKNQLFITNVGSCRAVLYTLDGIRSIGVQQFSAAHESEVKGLPGSNLGLDAGNHKSKRRIGGFTDLNDEPVRLYFLLLMSDGLYKTLENSRQSNEDVNFQIVSLVVAELQKQSTIDGVCQAVVDRICLYHHDAFIDRNLKSCERRDDMTLLLRLFNAKPGCYIPSPQRILPRENDEMKCEDCYLYARHEGFGGKAMAEFAAQKYPPVSTYGMSNEDGNKELWAKFQGMFGKANSVTCRRMVHVALIYNDVDYSGAVLCTTDQEGYLHFRQLSTDPKIGNKNQQDSYQVLADSNILNGIFTIEVVRHEAAELEEMATVNGVGQAVVDSIRQFYLHKFVNSNTTREPNADMTYLLHWLNALLRTSSAVPLLPPERPCSFTTVTLLAGDRHSIQDSSRSSIESQKQVHSYLDYLPPEILEQIIWLLPVPDILSCIQVCPEGIRALLRDKKFWNMCKEKEKDTELWSPHVHYHREFDYAYAILPFPSFWNCKVWHTKKLNPFESDDIKNLEEFCRSLEVLTDLT